MGARNGTRISDVAYARSTSVAPTATLPFLPNFDVIDGSSPHKWQVEPTMVVNRSGSIFVGWKEADGPSSSGVRVGASYSTDQGQTWAPNILMGQKTGCSNSDPWMALGPNDRVNYAYLEYSCGSPPDGLTVVNTTNGTWRPMHFLPGNGGLSDKDSIWVTASGRIYATWDEANVMFVTWSDDGGSTWASFVDPDDSPGGVLGGIIETNATGTVYVTWWDFASSNIYFDYSTDGGTTWHTDKRVNEQPVSSGFPKYPLPAMNVDQKSGAIYITWADTRNGNSDIFISASTDGGITWSANKRINDDTGSAIQYMPDLAIDSKGTVHAAWEDERTGAWNIFYSNSTDGGQTWSTNVKVSSADTPATYTRPGDYFAIEAGPNDYVYVVWTDGRGADFDIYYARNPGFPVASITVTTAPSGLPVTVDGTTGASPVTRNWTIGTTHTIGVSSPIAGGTGTQYVWTSWSDGGAVTHSILADSDRTVTAYFQKQYQAKIAPNPIGLSVLADNISYTAQATLWWNDSSVHWLEAPSPQYASPDVRSDWVSWSDGGARAHAVTVHAPLTVTASFIEVQALRVTTSPAGRSFSVDNVVYTGDTTLWYPAGQDLSVSVESPQAGATGVQYLFASWSDGGAQSHFVHFTGAMALQVTFTTQYYLTVTSPVPGTSGSGWYASGSTAVATATYDVYSAGPGKRFTLHGWSRDASGSGLSSNPILMDGPKTAVANYVTEFYLQVTSQYGSVSGSGWYANGSTAYANVASSEVSLGTGTRARFTGWGGDASGSDTRSAAITMDAPKFASATWSKEYLVTLESDVGTVQGGGWYADGASATLQAPPQATQNGQTYNFGGWTGDVTSTQPTVTITVTHPITARATWTSVGPLGVSGAGWSAIGIVVVIALVVGFLAVRRRRRGKT